MPLIILAFFSLTVGFLNNATSIFTTEKFTEWVRPALGQSFPELAHAPFHWSDAPLSIGLACSAPSCRTSPAWPSTSGPWLGGLTRRNKAAAAATPSSGTSTTSTPSTRTSWWPVSRAPSRERPTWFNQAVLDAIVNGVGTTTRRAGTAAYDFDQKVVDRAVNASGTAAEGSGQALRPVQSGKVQQYGAILFGAAAIGALILVITV